MKKLLILFIVFVLPVFIGNFITANGNSSDSLKATGQNMAKILLPFYQKLSTCSPYKSELTEIYGKTNNNCHFRMDFYDCNTPLSISEQYAKMGTQIMEAMAKWDTNTMDRMVQFKEIYTKYEQNTIKYYCRAN